MHPARGRQAGFTLVEVTIVLAITLLIAALVYKITRASWLLYRTQIQVTERGFSSLRAVDDMAVEIARAGFGLGDAGPLFPGTLDGTPAPDAITVRSNPEGIAGSFQEDLVDSGPLVRVEGAELFAVGNDVLLVDEEKALERAQVVRLGPESLGLRSRETPDGRFRRPFLTSLGARVLKVREVGFYLKTDRAGVAVLARKAPGQAEQVLARYVGELRFDYVDAASLPRDPRSLTAWRPERAVSGVRISLRLVPNPDLPPVTVAPLSVLVSLEPQSAAIAFDAAAYHTVGLAGVIGQDSASGDRKVRMHAWRNTIPLF
jgi:prepilin-type N-terminal cleavage/methylation domain-containing protein